jgi:hypothetical protein
MLCEFLGLGGVWYLNFDEVGDYIGNEVMLDCILSNLTFM